MRLSPPLKSFACLFKALTPSTSPAAQAPGFIAATTRMTAATAPSLFLF
jgi:hypothetical protein